MSTMYHHIAPLAECDSQLMSSTIVNTRDKQSILIVLSALLGGIVELPL